MLMSMSDHRVRDKDGGKVGLGRMLHIAKLCYWAPIDYSGNYIVDFIYRKEG